MGAKKMGNTITIKRLLTDGLDGTDLNRSRNEKKKVKVEEKKEKKNMA